MKLFKAKIIKTIYLVAEDTIDAEQLTVEMEERRLLREEVYIEAEAVKKTHVPLDGWNKDCLVYGRYTDNLTLGAALKENT